jgi:hypothetical protein
MLILWRRQSKLLIFFFFFFFSFSHKGEIVAPEPSFGQSDQRHCAKSWRDQRCNENPSPSDALVDDDFFAQTRRNVARVLTVMRQRLREEMKEKYKNAKYKVSLPARKKKITRFILAHVGLFENVAA